ncbi:hypothetical protein TNIN_300451 [Trichonephila inaurata madagascariensis]|uniref:Uncharacterized protein n=1 Tax=Trichonephila inaurata madagascariensis TaxID=2747483 RepID=A0A8X6X8L3_9ARAC|nr:hypothetical protein TNIN_300451 [Trichonephila inaurata madagascariensis]
MSPVIILRNMTADNRGLDVDCCLSGEITAPAHFQREPYQTIRKGLHRPSEWSCKAPTPQPIDSETDRGDILTPAHCPSITQSYIPLFFPSGLRSVSRLINIFKKSSISGNLSR